MTQVQTRPTRNERGRTLGASGATSAAARAPRGRARSTDRLVDEVESLARIGSYSLDIPSGRWVSSNGLDMIFGIDTAFDRSLEGWASLIHPADREAMVAYFTDEVLGRGRPFDRQYRIVRADTGADRWVHGRGGLKLDAVGRPVRMLGAIVDITGERRAQEALMASELRYAAIFEGSAEAILIAEVATKRFRWVNGAACDLLGYTRDELLELTVHDIHPAPDLAMVLDQFQALAEGRITVARSVPCRREDGTALLADIKGSTAVVDGVACNIGFFTDVTELRRLEAQDRKLAQAVEQTSEAILITGPTGVIEYVNAAFERLTGLGREAILARRTSLLESPQSPEVFEAMWQIVVAGGSWSGELVHRRPAGTERVAEASISPVYATDGTVAGYVAIERDVTAERALADERERLAAAVEQTSDSVVITDLAGTIEYVNPAFEKVSGYRREDVIGQNQRILTSGRQSAGAYRALRRRLTRGQSWTGVLISRRKDGSLYEEDQVISPIRGPGGEITGYVAVKRDVTALRAAESGLAREFRERAEVATALSRVQPRGSAEATAADICAELLGLPGIDAATIISFLDRRRAIPLAVGGPTGLPLAAGRLLPATRAAYLYERATQGPWAEAWQPRAADGRYGEAMAELGIRAVAYAPVRNGRGLLGVVAVATRDESYVRHLIDHLPAVGEFAAAASALLSVQLERGHRDALVRKRIRRALVDGGLRPFFQPIVALGSSEPVGYEALTHFADGTPPDRLIAEAHAVGLGPDLELACLTAALDASTRLAPDCWLSLNASPDMILDSSELAGLLRGRSRQIVIELTEHVEIDDYHAVRRAVAGFGPTVSLAVDDAGAGFASFRHILELRPAFVKLDRSLVAGIDGDPVRQALIVGMRHFARSAGCRLIAEGIETEAELAALQALEVPLGQGYLLGLPAPLAAE